MNIYINIFIKKKPEDGFLFVLFISYLSIYQDCFY